MNEVAMFGGTPFPSFIKSSSNSRVLLESAAIQGADRSRHRISIRGKVWRLVNPVGVETVIDSRDLFVQIIGANKHMSKIYYDAGYNLKDESHAAPICFSDNGIGASKNAIAPQNTSCAACPHAAWGSKIQNGQSSKACSDQKKLAVILANPGLYLGQDSSPIYELRIPAASLKAFNAAIKLIAKQGGEVPIEALICKLSFDVDSEFPRITFEWAGWAKKEMYEYAVLQMDTAGDEIDMMVGNDDEPATALKAKSALPEKPAYVEETKKKVTKVKSEPVRPAEAVVAQPEISGDELDALLDGVLDE